MCKTSGGSPTRLPLTSAFASINCTSSLTLTSSVRASPSCIGRQQTPRSMLVTPATSRRRCRRRRPSRTLALFNNTTNQPEVPYNNPALPERSHYFDVGVDQKVTPDLDIGFDTYYKIATDMRDDGQFGQAVVLTQFNWARGYSEGAEFKVKYHNGNFKAYANFSYNVTEATDAYRISTFSMPPPTTISSITTTTVTTCSG
jgi:hypothetical protein